MNPLWLLVLVVAVVIPMAWSLLPGYLRYRRIDRQARRLRNSWESEWREELRAERNGARVR